MKQALTDIAVNSEEKADVMRQFQSLNEDVIIYERFDANHGVSNIKLDAYNALGEIEEKTGQYLEEQETIDMLEEVGEAIAKDYLDSNPIQSQNVLPTATATTTAIGVSHQPLTVPIPVPAPTSLSSSPSSHSTYPESETQELFPNHDSPQNDEPTPLVKPLRESPPPLDDRQQVLLDSNEDSGIDTTEPETPLVAAVA